MSVCSGHAAPHPEPCRRHQSLQTEACCWFSLLLKATRFHFQSGRKWDIEPGIDASQASSRDKTQENPCSRAYHCQNLPTRCRFCPLHRYLGPDAGSVHSSSDARSWAGAGHPCQGQEPGRAHLMQCQACGCHSVWHCSHTAGSRGRAASLHSPLPIRDLPNAQTHCNSGKTRLISLGKA